MDNGLVYLTLIFGLLVLPRWLQRFKLPAPITSLALGIGAMLLWGDRTHDPVVVLLSTIGISSLFLFAGLEVDPAELRKGVRQLATHLVIRVVTLAAAAWLAWRYAGLQWQAAALVGFAVFTHYPLDVLVHVVRARDGLVDRSPELLQKLPDLVVHAFSG